MTDPNWWQQNAPETGMMNILSSNGQTSNVTDPSNWYTIGNFGDPQQSFSGSMPGSVVPNNGSFNWDNMFGRVSQGLGGLTSLAQLYGMFQNLGFQKKAFRFAQQGTKRNFNAEATAYNNQLDRQQDASIAYRTGNPSGTYAPMGNYGRIEKWT
jgi:hypothetical protein